MKPALFIQKVLLMEFKAFTSPSKLRQVNRALSKHNIVSGHVHISDAGAAWALFTAAACPCTQYKDIAGWVGLRMKEAEKEKHLNPVNILCSIMTKPAIGGKLESVSFTEDGLMKVLFIDGSSEVYPPKKEVPADKPFRVTIVPGAIIRKLADGIVLKVKATKHERRTTKADVFEK